MFCRAILILMLIAGGVVSEAARKPRVLTPFQKNVQSCLPDMVDLKKLNSVAKVYKHISEKYLLLSSEVLGREVFYKTKGEDRKLKFENGQVQIFKILEDEEGRLVQLNNEVRQRSLTTEAYLTQLLIHADIRSDWMQISEKRVGSMLVVVTTSNGEIKSLRIEKDSSKKKLDCARIEGVESCNCLPLN